MSQISVDPSPLSNVPVSKEVSESAQIDTLKKRLAREKQARTEAEATIEQKSRELFDANRKLEQLLSGSVKLLTDILAMSRPEVFEKAAKVQRWARRLAPHLDMKRDWELDLAAMLYELGTLSLSDDLVQKKASGQPLTDAEADSITESAQAAYKLLSNIPHMSSVAKAVLYSNKCFDGQGFPADDVKGHDIPKVSRVLKILIDLSNDSTGSGRVRDFKKMIERRHMYDLEILKIAFDHLRRPAGSADAEGEVLNLTVHQLVAGDVAHRDIMDKNEQLLLSAGSSLTDVTIHRLRTHFKENNIGENIEIVRKNEDGEEPSSTS